MPDELIQHVAVGELVPFVHQSRTVFDEDELRNLAEDIKANGLLQPGVAWLDPGRGKYVLICGERRWRASKLAGLPTMAVKVITGNLTQGAMLAINLSENLQRASLDPVERARSFQRLAQLECLTSKQVAERMHVSDATVSRDLAILELPEAVLTQVASGMLAASVAYELSRIDDTDAQLEMARAIIAGRMNRDQVAAEVRGRVGRRNDRPKPSRLACRFDNGLAVTVTVTGRCLTQADLKSASERLRSEAAKLPATPLPAAS